jgi:hypothetical protein
VHVRYDHILDGPNQNIFPAIGDIGLLLVKGKSSIIQKPANAFYPNGNQDAGLQQIAVAHQYPLTDDLYKGRLLFQSGEIQTAWPQDNIKLEGTTITGDPFALKDLIHRKVNLNPWLGKPARTWLCTEVEFDCLDFVKGLYRFGFEIQNDSDTWDPLVVFNDDRINLPPVQLEKPNADSFYGPEQVRNLYANPAEGTVRPAAYWYVPYLPAIDYFGYFQSRFDGFRS